MPTQVKAYSKGADNNPSKGHPVGGGGQSVGTDIRANKAPVERRLHPVLETKQAPPDWSGNSSIIKPHVSQFLDSRSFFQIFQFARYFKDCLGIREITMLSELKKIALITLPHEKGNYQRADNSGPSD